MSATEGEVRQRAQRLKEQVTEKTSQAAHAAKEKAGAAFETQRNRTIREIGNLAAALRQAGNTLRQQNSSSIGATVTQRVAERLDDVCTGLEGKDLDTIIRDAEDFGRRNPALLLSSCAVLGFISVRFLKSSGRGATTGVSPSWRYRDSDIAGGSPTISYAEEP